MFASIASGLAGVTAHLKNNPEIKWQAVFTAFMNSCLLGLAMSLVWFRSFQDNIYSLIGLCVLIGLMGSAGQEFFMSMVLKSGLTINFRPKPDEPDEGNKK
jgi:hypothetical protein